MAFQSYDQYIQNFGAALQGAGIQPPMQPDPQGAFGATPNGEPPPQEGMVDSGPPPQQQPPIPAPQAAGAFGPAPEGLAGAPPSGPFSPAPAAGPTPPPSGPFSPAPEEFGPTGLSMKKLFDDSSKGDREELAKNMEPQIPGGDLIKAAKAAEDMDPTLAEKWGLGEWTRHEAAAFLMEFGLRMMKASGSGEGNFFSDVGESALGATEARRAFKTEEEEKGFKREDREWEAKKRERDEGKWEAEDREETRERKRKAAEEMRKGETHELNRQLAEKNLETGTWKATISEDGHLIFTDPNTKEKWNTGIKASSRDAHGRASAFVEQLDAWRQTAAGLNEVPWEKMTPKQQSQIEQAFYDYQKTGVNSKAARSKFISDWVLETKKGLSHGVRNNPEAMAAALEAAKGQAMEWANDIYETGEEEVGGIPIFKDPVPDWSPEAN